MEVANTLVYYDTSTLLKSFIVQASRAVYTKFYFISNLRVGLSYPECHHAECPSCQKGMCNLVEKINIIITHAD